MYGNTLSEKILDYCETFDKDPRHIGEILSESENFKFMFHIDCTRYNIIKDDLLKQRLNSTITIDEW